MPRPLTPKQRAQSVIAQLRGIGSGRPMGFGKNRVMSLPDAVAQVIEEHLGMEHDETDYPVLPDEDDVKTANKQFDLGLGAELANNVSPDMCPVCGNVTFMNIEGCKKCFSCGHSEC